MIAPEHNKVTFRGMDLLREMLIKHYKDTPLALHYIMQLLARETDQLSFVAEPKYPTDIWPSWMCFRSATASIYL